MASWVNAAFLILGRPSDLMADWSRWDCGRPIELLLLLFEEMD
jgi:hypothetical protein